MSEMSGAHQASQDFATSLRAQSRSRRIGRYPSTQNNKDSKPTLDRPSQVPTLVSRVQRIYSDQSWATRGQFRPLVSNGVFTKPLMGWTNGIGYINGQSDQSYRRRPHRQIHRASETVGLHPGRLEGHRTIKGDNPSLPMPVKRNVGKTFLRNHKQSERGHPTSKNPMPAGGVRRSSGLRTSNSPKGQAQSVTNAPASPGVRDITRRAPGTVLSREVPTPDASAGRLVEASTPAGDTSPIERRSFSSAARMVF